MPTHYKYISSAVKNWIWNSDKYWNLPQETAKRRSEDKERKVAEERRKQVKRHCVRNKWLWLREPAKYYLADFFPLRGYPPPPPPTPLAENHFAKNSSGKLYASFSDFATILHHYFATSASFQKSRKHPPAALLLLNFNLPKIWNTLPLHHYIATLLHQLSKNLWAGALRQ